MKNRLSQKQSSSLNRSLVSFFCSASFCLASIKTTGTGLIDRCQGSTFWLSSALMNRLNIDRFIDLLITRLRPRLPTRMVWFEGMFFFCSFFLSSVLSDHRPPMWRHALGRSSASINRFLWLVGNVDDDYHRRRRHGGASIQHNRQASGPRPTSHQWANWSRPSDDDGCKWRVIDAAVAVGNWTHRGRRWHSDQSADRSRVLLPSPQPPPPSWPRAWLAGNNTRNKFGQQSLDRPPNRRLSPCVRHEPS